MIDRSDAIVKDWQAFAGSSMTRSDGVDAAEVHKLFESIVAAIASAIPRNAWQASEASPPSIDDLASPRGAAYRYGELRQRCGVSSGSVVREFSALRNAVLTRWRAHAPQADKLAIEQGLRFSHAVDAALQASIDGFVAALTSARDRYLFTLGEDMRHPLSAIHLANTVLVRPDFAPGTRQNAARHARRALVRMDGLLSSLLEYTRNRTASSIPIECSPLDLRELCEECIDVARMAHSGRTFELALSGDLATSVDGPRLTQAITNLLKNAAEHGAPETPIRLAASATSAGFALSVWNAGPAIPRDILQAIFEPRILPPSSTSGVSQGGQASLGLGLFIVREIAVGHGGDVRVVSNDSEGTRFTLHLPAAAEGIVSAVTPSGGAAAIESSCAT